VITVVDDPRERPATSDDYDYSPDIPDINVQDWFPFGADGDNGISWEEAGITPPATLAEYFKIYGSDVEE
jgi:hypothetical protein